MQFLRSIMKCWLCYTMLRFHLTLIFARSWNIWPWSNLLNIPIFLGINRYGINKSYFFHWPLVFWTNTVSGKIAPIRTSFGNRPLVMLLKESIYIYTQLPSSLAVSQWGGKAWKVNPVEPLRHGGTPTISYQTYTTFQEKISSIEWRLEKVAERCGSNFLSIEFCTSG